ncbi:MAG: hypothetical protein ACW981_09665 [Candidatus Hodarchaeales archaeon]|jgi:hypothetical protein
MKKQKRIPNINLDKLVNSIDRLDMNLTTIKAISNQNELEKLFDEKIDLAKQNFEKNNFLKFWEVFLFLIFGEIELKSKVNNYIEMERPTDKVSLENVDSVVIVLIGFFVSYRHSLVDYLYDNILHLFNTTKNEVSKKDLFYDVQKFIIIIISSLKIIVSSLNKDSIWLTHRIHRLVIDDIEYSLYSALNLGNLEFLKQINNN